MIVSPLLPTTTADNSVSPANTSISTAVNNGVSDAANDSISTPIPSDFETVGTSGIIDPGRVLYLRRKSCSRRNFSAKLNQYRNKEKVKHCWKTRQDEIKPSSCGLHKIFNISALSS